jgi:dihydrofolate reductase
MSDIKTTLIAAVARDRGIGMHGKLPWHLPEDLKRFRARTRGHPVIMGRKTLDSIGRALPDRPNFVITRDPSKVQMPGGDIRVVGSLSDALEQAQRDARSTGKDEVFVIGGGEIYRQALPLADQLDLTEVDITLGAQADAFFPVWNEAEFQELERTDYPVTAARPLGFRVRVLSRRR